MVAVEPVWLCERHSGDCREGRPSRGRARDVDVPETQIQEQTVEVAKEIPQEIDAEKLTDEDVDEMTLETDVDDDAQQCRMESDAVGYGMVFTEDVSTATVEVEQSKTVISVLTRGLCVSLQPVTSELS